MSTLRADQEASDRQKYQRARDAAIGHWETKVPADYAGADLASCTRDEHNRVALDACRELIVDLAGWARSGLVVILAGQVGTGKTFLARALARGIVRSGWLPGGADPVRTWNDTLQDRPKPINQVVWIDWLRHLERLKRSWKNGPPAPSGDELAAAEWLVLDDIGAPDSFGEWAQGQLLAVVHERVQSRRPMIVTTNLTLSGAPAERLDPRIVSRLRTKDRCWMIAVKGPSRR